MAHLILLFYLFHCLFRYGRAQFGSRYNVPAMVRSPYLNCWALVTGELEYPIVVGCDTSQWDPAPIACYFLAQHNSKIDFTLDL
jgi:hypothetical protein